MRNALFGLLLCLVSQWGVSAESSSVEKEIQKLKPNLETSTVISVRLKTGEVLAAATFNSNKVYGLHAVMSETKKPTCVLPKANRFLSRIELYDPVTKRSLDHVAMYGRFGDKLILSH